MAFTSHGHHIPGSPDLGPCPIEKVDCGGFWSCVMCNAEERHFVRTGNLPKIRKRDKK